MGDVDRMKHSFFVISMLYISIYYVRLTLTSLDPDVVFFSSRPSCMDLVDTSFKYNSACNI